MKISKLLYYLLNVEYMSLTMANKTLLRFNKHPDILYELEYWAKTHQYTESSFVKAAGYSAYELSELIPNLSGLDIFNLMVSLREYSV